MLNYLALMAYILTFTHVVLFLIFQNNAYRVLINIFAGLGLAINILELASKWNATGQIPTGTLYDFLILLSIAFVATYFIIYAKFKRPLIALFIIPFSICLSVMSLFVPVETIEYPIVDSIWRLGHLPFIILGVTMFAASFFSAVMYFIQEKQVKSKNFGFIFQRFPPLDTINKINSTTLALGFYLFTIGAVLGFAWLVQTGINDRVSVYKLIFSVITWGLFGAIFALKWKKGIAPKNMVIYTIIGFISLVITYLGVAAFLIG